MGKRLPAVKGLDVLTCPACGKQVPFPSSVAYSTRSALQDRSPEVVTAFAYIVLGHECSRPSASRA